MTADAGRSIFESDDGFYNEEAVQLQDTGGGNEAINSIRHGSDFFCTHTVMPTPAQFSSGESPCHHQGSPSVQHDHTEDSSDSLSRDSRSRTSSVSSHSHPHSLRPTSPPTQDLESLRLDSTHQTTTLLPLDEPSSSSPPPSLVIPDDPPCVIEEVSQNTSHIYITQGGGSVTKSSHANPHPMSLDPVAPSTTKKPQNSSLRTPDNLGSHFEFSKFHPFGKARVQPKPLPPLQPALTHTLEFLRHSPSLTASRNTQISPLSPIVPTLALSEPAQTTDTAATLRPSPFVDGNIRKKSEEPLKSSLKSIQRPSLAIKPPSKSEPGTPTHVRSGSVGFAERLDHVKLFFAEQKPIAVSRDGSPTEDTSGTESEPPVSFRRTSSDEKKRLLVNTHPGQSVPPLHPYRDLPPIHPVNPPHFVLPPHPIHPPHDHISSTLAMGPPIHTTTSATVYKPEVTTTATVVTRARRSKADANFACPVPGCGSTFNRHFQLKGTLNHFYLKQH